MIYETAIILRPETDESNSNSVKAIISDVLKEFSGEVLLKDDWGVRSFAQPINNGLKKGHYIYFMFKTNNSKTNSELERRYKINENVIRSMVVKLGPDKKQAEIVNDYKTPKF